MEEKLRKEYQALDLKIGAYISIQVDLTYKPTDLKTGKRLLEMAERKLEIGRKVNNLVLFHDLMDCLVLLRVLGKVLKQQTHIQRHKELMAEFEKIHRCHISENFDLLHAQLQL